MRSFGIRLGALVVFLLGLPLLGGPQDPSSGPLPRIQRVHVNADRVAIEVARVPGETWKQLPRPEFDKLVQQAEQAALRPRPVARLIETHIRAVLQGEDLVGSTIWKVMGPEDGPSFLPLQTPAGGFNRALRRPPRAGQQDLLLVEVEGQGPTLFFDTPGLHTVDLAWSARLERTSEGLAFDLRGLPCPAGILELFLPAGWGLTGPADLLVTGPARLPPMDQRGELEIPDGFALWRLHGVGRGAFRLTLMRTAPASPPLALVRRTLGRHRLAPEAVESTFEVEVEPRPRGTDTLAFEWEPSLRPTAVEVAPVVAGGSVPELVEWKLTSADQQPGLLVLRFRGPVAEVLVTVKAISPLTGRPASGGTVEWSAPPLRAVRGVARDETVELLVHPDLRVDGWQGGDFRTVGTDSFIDAERRITWNRWTLTGGGLRLEDRTQPRRPSLLMYPAGVEFRARSVSWWRLDPLRTTLRTTVAIEVQQGRLFGVPVQLPPGWEVEQVDVEPLSLGANWWLRREKNRALVQVEFQAPLTAASPILGSETARPRSQARVKLRLRPGQPGLSLGKALPFPEVLIPGARFREGGLGIQLQESLLEGKVTSPLPTSDPEEDGPWERELPDYYLPYRQQALTGSLTLTARRSQWSGQVRTAVYLTPAQGIAETRLRLLCEAGTTGHVDLLLTGAELPDWEWQTESGTVQVRRVERLPLPDLGYLLAHIGRSLPSAPRLTCCRVTLSRPLRPGERIELLARSRLDSDDHRWDVPLPVLLGSDRAEGEVEVHLARIELSRVEQEGLREMSAADRSRGRGSWRGYRYTGGPVRLVVQGREATPERLVEVQARLTAWLDEGRPRVHYRFLLADWNQYTLPVRLPPGAALLGVTVDGRPLPIDTTTLESGEVALTLPVPVREARKGHWLCYELLYQLPPVSGLLWQSLPAPAPMLPVEPTTLQRTWRLPPATLPAFPGQVTRLPSGGDGIEPPARRIHPADLFQLIPWPRRWQEVFEPPGDRDLSYPFALALRTTRPGTDLSMRDLLEVLVTTALREQQEVLVDTVAWRQARLRLDARVRSASGETDGEPLWESAGLSLIPAAEGWLLTTGRQRQLWGSGSLPWTVTDALDEAVFQGHDRSGRFRTLDEWLPHAVTEERQGEELRGETLLPTDLELPGWSSWGAIGSDPVDSVLVVRRELVASAGLVLALLCGLVSLALRQALRWRRRLWFIVWLAVAGLALFWLPTSLQPLAWYPLVLGGILVLLAYLRRIRRAADPGDPSTASGTSPGLMAALLLVLLFVARESSLAQGEEQQAAPAAVNVLIAGKLDDPLDQQTVWAPVSLLDRLAQAANVPTVQPRDGALLTSIRCTGKRVGNVLEFEAQLEIHSFSSRPVMYLLPLEGVHLQLPLKLKSLPILPLAPVEPQRGYPIRLPGPGLHQLEVHFRVPVQSPVPGESVAQFTLPRAMLSRLNLTLTEENTVVQIPGRLGALRSERTGAVLEVEADLGRMTGPVQVRWNSVAGAQRPGSVRYQEAYLWDLRPDGSTLTGVLQYSIQKGSVRELVVDVPGNLVVRGVTASRPETGEARLQSFQVREVEPQAGKVRQELVLPFSGPVSGDLLVELDLVPRGALPLNAELPLPTPRGEQVAGYLAYRTEGLDARPVSLLRLTGIRPEGFAPFWPAASRPEARVLTFAASLTRPGGAAPELRVQLVPRPVSLAIEQELTLRVSVPQVDLQVRLDIPAASVPLTQLEWEITGPAVTLASVRGPGLRRWTQQGNRLQVWLERVTTGKLEVHGWFPVVQEPQKPARLEVPQFRPLQGNRATTTVRLQPQPGYTVRPQQLNGLTGGSPAYTATGNYSGTFLVEANRTSGTARILTLLEVVERQLVFQTLISCRLPQSELRTLTVGVRGWEGTVLVEAERVAQRRERTLAGGARSWTLDLQPGVVRDYHLLISGACPIGDLTGSPTMPEVTLSGLATSEHWLVVAGAELQASGSVGLHSQMNLPTDLPVAFRGPERLRRAGGSVWRTVTTPWHLPLTLAMPNRDPGQPVRVLLSEQRLRSNGRGGWLHEALCWVRCDEQAELVVQFPTPGRVTSVTLGEIELAPLQPTQDRLWVPLPGQAGVLPLRFRWAYDVSGESQAQPVLTPPRLEGAVQTGPTLWTVTVPAGWQADPLGEFQRGPAARVQGHLLQAEAAIQAAAQLGEMAREQGYPTGQEMPTQLRVYRHLRRVEILLEHHPEVAHRPGSDGKTPTESLARLHELNREQARPNQWNYETVRVEAERQSRGSVVPPAPTTGSTMPGIEARLPSLGRGRRVGETPPQVPTGRPLLGWTRSDTVPTLPDLEPTWRVSVRQAINASLVWLILVVVVACLSQVDFLVNRLRPLLPEQLVLVGALGLLVAGWTVTVLALLVLGVLARGWLLFRWLRPRSRRR